MRGTRARGTRARGTHARGTHARGIHSHNPPPLSLRLPLTNDAVGMRRPPHPQLASLNSVQKGDVVVIRYQGPKGGPGMPEMRKDRRAHTRPTTPS